MLKVAKAQRDWESATRAAKTLEVSIHAMADATTELSQAIICIGDAE
jgi:hypothetical protein